MYSNYSNLFNTEDVEAFGATTLVVILLVTLLVCFALIAFKVICRWKIFKKAGKEGWEAVIPYYSGWTYYEVSGYPGWIVLFNLAGYIPYLGWAAAIALVVFDVMAGISLARKFNKSDAFGVLVGLLPIIGLPILAFGKDEYDGSLGEHHNIQQI